MSLKLVLTLTVIVVQAAATMPTVHAQAMPSKPYSQWTRGEQQTWAQHLKKICTPKCARYVPTQQGQRGFYEASACTIACFAGNLPADYPGLANMKQSAWQNYNQAKALGSNMPVPAVGR
jgi:hypothetical protein